jgi:hypothetical protein
MSQPLDPPRKAQRVPNGEEAVWYLNRTSVLRYLGDYFGKEVKSVDEGTSLIESCQIGAALTHFGLKCL